MEKEDYKPVAKCQYYGQCFLYNGNAIPLEVETKMCGRSQETDKDYKPYVPEPENLTPTKIKQLSQEGKEILFSKKRV